MLFIVILIMRCWFRHRRVIVLVIVRWLAFMVWFVLLLLVLYLVLLLWLFTLLFLLCFSLFVIVLVVVIVVYLFSFRCYYRCLLSSRVCLCARPLGRNALYIATHRNVRSDVAQRPSPTLDRTLLKRQIGSPTLYFLVRCGSQPEPAANPPLTRR